MLWIKFIYFLRIFSLTGHYVRILTDVVFEMKYFLFIIMIVYLGFGDAFLRLSEASTSDSQWILNFGDSFI